MRIGGWLFLVAGAACLVAAAVLGIRAIQQAAEIAAYQHARPCRAGAPAEAGCLRAVDGSVTAVAEFPGGYRINPHYALDVRTGAGTLHLTFTSDSPMLGSAVDGDPAVVTMWRGIAVSVRTDGRSEPTVAVPSTAVGGDLRDAGQAAFVAAFLGLVGWACWRKRKLAGRVVRPALPPGHVRAARPAVRARVFARRAIGYYAPILLTVAVLFGVLFTCTDGPTARAYRHAPACAGETNLDTCAGDFTAVVNGVRTPVNGTTDAAEVSYATGDGVINTWATFDGNAGAIGRAAGADELAGTSLRIRVWRRAIVGAEFGGSWHWAEGDPPGNTYPTLLLAVSFGLLLLAGRLRIHRRPGPAAERPELIADDLGQAALAAAGIVLLAIGFWPGAVLVLAALVWLGLSVKRSSGAIMVA